MSARGWNYAAALAPHEAAQIGRAWMTALQFDSWADGVSPLHTRGDPILKAIGLTRLQVRVRRRGEVAISKVEGLACAHFSLGLELPAAAIDPARFGDWFGETFGTARQVGQWLDLPTHHLTDRIQGFTIRGQERIPRPPELALARALAWVDQVGPVYPWPLAEKIPSGSA